MEPATQTESSVLTAVDVSASAVVSRRVNPATCTEEVLLLKLELANERVAIADERAAMAAEREAIAVQRVAEAERWLSMCEERTKMMASDAERVLCYANEAARCLSLMRDVERRCAEESKRCRMLCQEVGHLVADKTERRQDAEEHAATVVEQTAVSTAERRVNAVMHDARLHAEADRRTLTMMDARISKLEKESDELRRRLAGGTKRQEGTSVVQREAADERAEQEWSTSGALVQCTDSATVVAKTIRQDSAVPPAQSKTDMVLGEDVAVRSCAATLHLPTPSTKRVKRQKSENMPGAVGSAKWTCIRCGGCDHLHEQCEAGPEAVIWGIDWSKRRKSRRRGRKAQKRIENAGTKTCGVAKVKPTVKVTGGTARVVVMSETCVQEGEPYAWLGADFVSYLKEVERLQRKAKATETLEAAARSLMQSLELKEVADEIGVGAKMETSTGGRFQEVADRKECRRGRAGQRRARLLEEVVPEGERSREDPATRRTSPEW
jgi:hypothetical protein